MYKITLNIVIKFTHKQNYKGSSDLLSDKSTPTTLYSTSADCSGVELKVQVRWFPRCL